MVKHIIRPWFIRCLREFSIFVNWDLIRIMKVSNYHRFSFLFFLSFIVQVGLLAQEGVQLFAVDQLTLRDNPSGIQPEWAPFFHGVASGDPLHDRVIIWTRVTPDTLNEKSIEVHWTLATDPQMKQVISTGSVMTDQLKDYTVKVDVMGLTANTVYYYVFRVLDRYSLVGKTKTSPLESQSDHLRFGVVSCSNYQSGYFNAYRRLAERNDLDAIIHLGDYIYEYEEGGFANDQVRAARPLKPENEVITLNDYRMRYSHYKLDTSLARVHQQHPFITVWDDHETANDAYKDGAQNHQESSEGSWQVRKMMAKQAYLEWMPVRETKDTIIYRTFHYGDLMDLIMLDTRLEGRDKQILDFFDPALQDSSRTILGAKQKSWFFDQLMSSKAKWKVIGQQVIFSEFNVGWASIVDNSISFSSVEGASQDKWDGYPAERTQIIDFIKDQDINNVVIITGDSHASFAFDVADKPVNLSFQAFPSIGDVPIYSSNENYNAATGAGSAAVEFGTPSITSANYDENFSPTQASIIQQSINNTINLIPGLLNLGNPNPHLKYNELSKHGYLILNITSDTVQSDWYFSEILNHSTSEELGGMWYTADQTNHLSMANKSSNPKSVQDTPAPLQPFGRSSSTDNLPDLALLGVYPNPFKDYLTIHFSVAKSQPIRMDITQINGQIVQSVLDQLLPAGTYQVHLDGSSIPAGIHLITAQLQSGNQAWQIIKQQ